MKKVFLIMMVAVMTSTVAMAQKDDAQIKFEKTTHNFGNFSENDAVQTCVFTFTNAGKTPLVITRAVASCGCTTPSYTKTPIAPGGKGEVKVTYNGTGKFPGHFKKTVTIETNGTPEMVRLYVEGTMTEEPSKK